MSDCSLTYRQAPAARLTREQPEAFNPIRVNVKVITSQGTQGQVNVPVKVSLIVLHLPHNQNLNPNRNPYLFLPSQGQSRSVKVCQGDLVPSQGLPSSAPSAFSARACLLNSPRPKNPQKPQQLLIIAILCRLLRGVHSTPLQILPLPAFAKSPWFGDRGRKSVLPRDGFRLYIGR